MANKDFKVKNKLQVAGITSAGPIVADASGNFDSTPYIATQYGGTGTTTSPNAGQVLYSTSGSTYAPTTLADLVTGAKYQADAPTSPAVGQIWIESDSESTSFDPNLIRRQAFTATAGQTIFTTAISFIEGYEQVYFNGLLLLRSTDYITSGGNTVTLTSAAAADDIIEVVTITNVNSTNTYTQAEIDSALSAKLSTSTAASTYLTQSNASSTYLTQSSASSTYLTSSTAASTYLTSSNASSTYLTQTNAASTYVPQANYNVAGKNAVINGGFDIWQRGTSFAMSSAGYSADRWYQSATSGETISRQTTSDSTNLPFIQYCARVARDSGSTTTTAIRINTMIESVNSIPFAGKTVTLSFYARRGANLSSANNVLIAQLASGTGTDQNLFAGGYTGLAYPIADNVTLTTTWQRFTLTGTIASTATELSLLFYFVPVGTAGASDYFEITGVQLELGSIATSFSRSGGDIQGELAKCQRYYQKSFNQSVAPVNGGSNPDGQVYFTRQASSGSVEPTAWVNLKQTMRTAPGVTLYNPYLASPTGQWSDGSTSSANARVINISDSSFTIDNTDVLYATSNYAIHFVASAEL